MYHDLNVFRLAHAMAQHAGARQAIVAENMANSDTPNYVARDITPFKEVAGDTGFTSTRAFEMQATRVGHVTSYGTSKFSVVSQPVANVEPSGNGVSIESEMVRAIETERQHSRALAIYKSHLTQLRAALGRQ